MPQPEQSSMTRSVIARLHSPDFHSQRHRRGEVIGASSPRVPRVNAHLRAEASQSRRMQSPLQALASQRHREKSGEHNTFFTGNDIQDLTQMMSNGTNEQTINLGPQTAGQALFNQTAVAANTGGNQPNQNSFLLDPVFNDYYIEYIMLHKLQALTNNFTCQTCWQVLNFQKFFDEDHDCLRKVSVPNQSELMMPSHTGVVRHSHIGSDYAEEFKEARAMFGPSEGTSLRVQQEDSEETKDPMINSRPVLSKQESIQSAKSGSV